MQHCGLSFVDFARVEICLGLEKHWRESNRIKRRALPSVRHLDILLNGKYL